MLVPLPIDEQLMPIAQRLANKAIQRNQAGELKVELLLSPASSQNAGRLQLLVAEIFLNRADTSATVTGYTGPGHLGVIKVEFEGVN